MPITKRLPQIFATRTRKTNCAAKKSAILGVSSNASQNSSQIKTTNKMKTNLLLTFIFAVNVIFAQIPKNGLVAYYALDGNANADSAICMNNGTNNGALSTSNSCSIANSAMSFNGTSNYIEVADCAGLHVAQSLSICAWVKAKGFCSGLSQNNYIVSKGFGLDPGAIGLMYADGDDNDAFVLTPSLEKFYLSIGGIPSSGNQVLVKSSTIVQLNVWYFVVGTFDGMNMKMYVNAAIEKDTSFLSNIAINTDNLLIGKHKPVGSNFDFWVNGDIDDVLIYNRALMLSEIQDIYNSHCWATALETEIQNAVKLFPNPASQTLQIEWNTIQPEKIEIIDFTGKSILQKDLETGNESTNIDVSNLAKGIYLVKVFAKEEEYLEKFVKE